MIRNEVIMKYKVGDFLIETGYGSGNRYIYRVIRVLSPNIYTLKLVARLLIREKLARWIEIGNIENKRYI